MAEEDHTLLVMTNVSKSFPGVHALENVNFSLKMGEIHCLIGENGAGKSTLIKVLTGVDHPDSGKITLNGKEIHVRSPQHAQELGISTVYQEINLCINLSVAENILLGHEPHNKVGGLDHRCMNEMAADLLQSLLGITIDVTQRLDTYSVAIQQMVAIARALFISSAKILILDEPTSSLDALETQQLFKVMKKLRNDGIGIIFITHFMSQVFEVSDRITVLRNGKLVGTFETAALTRIELITKMIGRTLVEFDEMTRVDSTPENQIEGKVILSASGLGRIDAVAPIDLELRNGEVIGLAGLLGSGRTEIANLLFGSDKPDSGSITMNGTLVHDYSPLGSIKRGLGLCPEDRKAAGIIDELTVRENIILAMQASKGWFKYLSGREQYEIADKYIEMLNIATPSPDQPVKNLSGGNQQKVILARWLATNPQVLILDEPTRGIDIGAKAEIQKLVLSLAQDGKAIVFISSELEEVLRVCSRIEVLRDREKVAEFCGEFDETKIMHEIAGSES